MKKILFCLLVLISGCMGTFNNTVMATSISMPYCNQNTGDVILASHWNSNCSTVQSFLNNQNLDGNTNIAVGGIQTANLANLSVTDAKIAGITTAGKVNGSSITGINNLPSGAGVIPTANLGSGTANSTTFLRGDSTFAAVTQSYVKISNTQTQNTAGGTATNGAWQIATLNTKDSDTDSIATLSSNKITLPAGTYIVKAYMPFYVTNLSQARLFNNTDSSVLLNGTSIRSDSGANGNSQSLIMGKIVLGASKDLYLQYQVLTTEATNGQGLPSNFGAEVYAQIEFIKVG